SQYRRRTLHAICALGRRGGYWMDVLYAVLDDVFQYACHRRCRWRLHRRLRLNRRRRQFHRDDTHVARTGNDMVPSTTLRLGDLCDQPRDGPGYAGPRGDAIARDRGALAAPADFQSSAGWRSAAVPAPVLV